MTRKVIHVALNGVTGRMGYRQHLVRSLLAIREQGGVRLEDGTSLYPEPILSGSRPCSAGPCSAGARTGKRRCSVAGSGTPS